MNQWANYPGEQGQTRSSGVAYARYTLKGLFDQNVLDGKAVNTLLKEAGLTDFGWDLIWATTADEPERSIADRLAQATGVLIFVHGWTGTRAIWEDIPALAVSADPGLIALVVDHNGFGATQFAGRTPSFEQCSPPTAMGVLERLIDLLGVQPPIDGSRPVTFIGHSMGGAMLFFLNEARWPVGSFARFALAPALLLKDRNHRAFYDALGFGIDLINDLPVLKSVERLIEPEMINILAGGASAFVQAEHRRIYEITPRGITAQTLAAMGLIRAEPQPRLWPSMTVMLSHADRLVGLDPMLALLDTLAFESSQVRVVFGTHYFFSPGEGVHARMHLHNRSLVVDQIHALHQSLRQPTAQN